MQSKYSRIKILGWGFILFLFVFFIVPNVINSNERKAFSDDQRLKDAKIQYNILKTTDSVEIIPGDFYDKKGFIIWLSGETYLELWQQKIKVPVLNLKSIHGGLVPVKFSGGQQTIGIDAKDKAGNEWSIRSVNKDQSKALPGFLQSSILRPLFRDQASALNPYGTLAVAELSQAIGLYHSNPGLYFFPYDISLGKYNDRMAGRLVTLVKDWEDDEQEGDSHKSGASLMNTGEMFTMAKSKKIPIDAQMYARCRLFDMLISDWDRHEGNWKWVVKKQNNTFTIMPVAVDRDMAFYNFGNGILNKVALCFTNKFQSFTPEYKSVDGLMQQSKAIDVAILGPMSEKDILQESQFIQSQLTAEVISKAFMTYPEEAYALIGQKHRSVLKQRLQKLPEVAKEFYALIRKEVK